MAMANIPMSEFTRGAQKQAPLNINGQTRDVDVEAARPQKAAQRQANGRFIIHYENAPERIVGHGRRSKADGVQRIEGVDAGHGEADGADAVPATRLAGTLGTTGLLTDPPTGRETITVVPTPASDCTSIRPPCACTIP